MLISFPVRPRLVSTLDDKPGNQHTIIGAALLLSGWCATEAASSVIPGAREITICILPNAYWEPGRAFKITLDDHAKNLVILLLIPNIRQWFGNSISVMIALCISGFDLWSKYCSTLYSNPVYLHYLWFTQWWQTMINKQDHYDMFPVDFWFCTRAFLRRI